MKLVLRACENNNSCLPSIQKTLRARTKKILRNYFPRDCAKLSQSIARNNSWGIVFGAIAQFCCCSLLSYCYCSGSEKGVFWKRGLFRKVHFLEILENLEILEILENPQTVENKGESDHFLEILENLEILEILEIFPVKKTPFVMTPFSSPEL